MRGRPILLARLAVVTVALLISLARFLAIDAESHSVSDTIRPWFLETAVIALVAAVVIGLLGRLGAPKQPSGP